MDPQHALIGSWPDAFSRTVEMMTGAAVRVAEEPGPAASSLWWQNRLSTSPPVILSVGASRETWLGIGTAVLEAAGVDGAAEDEARSTWLELLEQAASAVAGDVTTPQHRTESSAGSETSAPEGTRHRVVTQINGDTFALELVVAVDQSSAQEASRPQTAAMVAAAGGSFTTTTETAEMSMGRPLQQLASRTMDALLDVHLPVSISFGQARMPLKDVLKLTAGTVVELNRQPEDPVDIIVNDCVIARGEVVVVDGNYAVRIQSIVGRQERLGLPSDRRENGKVTS